MRFHETRGAPYILRLCVDGTDVTEKYDLAKLLGEASYRFRAQSGRQGDPLVAASTAKNVLHVLRDKRVLTHSPGPRSPPGGYPVRIGADRVEVALPPGVSMDDAVSVNEACNKYDGVEEIRDDGTVVIMDESYEIMKQLLGYDCKEMKLAESAERAAELRARLQEWAR
jgi:hypothetical protein